VVIKHGLLENLQLSSIFFSIEPFIKFGDFDGFIGIDTFVLFGVCVWDKGTPNFDA